MSQISQLHLHSVIKRDRGRGHLNFPSFSCSVTSGLGARDEWRLLSSFSPVNCTTLQVQQKALKDNVGSQMDIN